MSLAPSCLDPTLPLGTTVLAAVPYTITLQPLECRTLHAPTCAPSLAKKPRLLAHRFTIDTTMTDVTLRDTVILWHGALSRLG